MTEPRDGRPPRCRPLPPMVVDSHAAPSDHAEELALLARLDEALSLLPDDERTAVVASYAYGEGVVGAAVELDVEQAAAERLGLAGLARLREALAAGEAS